MIPLVFHQATPTFAEELNSQTNDAKPLNIKLSPKIMARKKNNRGKRLLHNAPIKGNNLLLNASCKVEMTQMLKIMRGGHHCMKPAVMVTQK